MSEVGFEPTPTFVDQNTHSATILQRRSSLESGALDHSAILTVVCEAHHCHFVLKHFSEEAFWMSVLVLATATVV